MLALNKFTDVFERIQPYRQKELLSLVLHKTILMPESIKIALYGRPPEIGRFSLGESEIRSQTPIWLPNRNTQRTNTHKTISELIPCYYRYYINAKTLLKGEKPSFLPEN